jgi:hypothetical protein
MDNPFSASFNMFSILRIMPEAFLGERKFNFSNNAIIFFLEASRCLWLIPLSAVSIVIAAARHFYPI